MRARAPIILGALRMGARAPILWGRAPIILGAHPEPTSTHPLSNPLPPSCLQHQLITPLLPLTWVRGGPHTPPPLLTSNPQLRPRGLRTAF